MQPSQIWASGPSYHRSSTDAASPPLSSPFSSPPPHLADLQSPYRRFSGSPPNSTTNTTNSANTANSANSIGNSNMGSPLGASPPNGRILQADIWSPMYCQQTLRGGSFGAYGNSPSVDSEQFRSGNVAWGSAELPRRRLQSFPSAEPGTQPFLTALNRTQPQNAAEKIPLTGGHISGALGRQLDFTGPSISLLDRFGNLGDATRQAELKSRGESPRSSHAQLWKAPSTESSPLIASTALSEVPVPVPVPVGTKPKDKSKNHSNHSNHGPSDASSSASCGSGPVPGASSTAGSGSGGHSASDKKARKKRGESTFLEKLRSALPGSMSLPEILGNVVEASTDQHGSRFIQKKLATAPPSTKHQVLSEVLPDALSLATDVFGNYVVQLLFEVSSSPDRTALWGQLRGQMLPLTLHMYGCRVIQMALLYLDNAGRQHVVEELKGNVLRCIKDHNGNHVIQKAVEHVPPISIPFVYSDMLEHTLALSGHMYGCRVIQRALEFGSPQVKSKLLQIIKDNIGTLVLDQYGNYVVQHVVEHGPKRDREFVLERLSSNVVTLSEHKYASNVIERCFIKSSPSQRSAMVDSIVNGTNDGEPAVLAMMKDQYANYVIQRILGTVRDDDYDRLSQAVKRNLPMIRRGHHQGKHLLAIERRLR